MALGASPRFAAHVMIDAEKTDLRITRGVYVIRNSTVSRLKRCDTCAIRIHRIRLAIALSSLCTN